MSTPKDLDRLDRRILAALQRDGRMHNTDLAREVGLSPSPCLRRVNLLEESGVIDRYVALVNPAKVGYPMTFFTRVWLLAQDEETISRFVAAMEQLPQVLECYLMLGDSDALMRVVAADIEDYRCFQSAHMTKANGIQNVKTDVPSQTVKQTTALPL
jgi:Lrp/AsnC family transcriptional regulator, leucine-responsive regulatory protein